MTDRTTAPKQTTVDFNESDFNRLQEIKERHGVTWRGMLIAGAVHLTQTTPFPDPPELPPEIPLQSRDCGETNQLPGDDRHDEQDGAS